MKAPGDHPGKTLGNSDPTAPADPRDELVLEEARRGIDVQKGDLQGLRNRAGAAVGYATVVASVLAGLSLRGDAKPTPWTWAGLVALAAACLFSAYVLRPAQFTFAFDTEAMDARIDNGDTIAAMLRDTSMGIHRDRVTNQKKLDGMHLAYLLSLLAVLAETRLLLVDLARR